MPEGPVKFPVFGAIVYTGYGPHPSISNSERGTQRGQDSDLPPLFYKEEAGVLPAVPGKISFRPLNVQEHGEVVAEAAAQYAQVPDPVVIRDLVVINVKIHAAGIEHPAGGQQAEAPDR